MMMVTENETQEVFGTVPDDVWLIVYTVKSRLTGVIIRKLYATAFPTQRDAEEFHAEYGDFYDRAGMDILTVDVTQFGRVPF